MDQPSDSTRGHIGHIAHPHYLADLLVGVAFSDGNLDMAEASVIAQLIRTAVKEKLDMKLIRDLVKESKHRLEAEGIEDVVVAAGKQLGAAGQIELAIGMAIDVAEASYGIGEEERQAILLCAVAGGMTPSEVERLMSRNQKS